MLLIVCLMMMRRVGSEDGTAAGMDTGSGVYGAWILLCQLQRVPRALEAGAGDDELGATDLLGPADNRSQVIRVSACAVIPAAEDGVGEVDADLLLGLRQSRFI